ncbi:Ig-like domain-containing protein [Deinococcus cavernae]|uniref:Ig-like domain-containing protein n=1 Tax=Deinococcus cavernae TaxID=2320857 RepID=UPI0013142919|nr:Ig-like domain-containing protein [Deinococcus cavernae]
MKKALLPLTALLTAALAACGSPPTSPESTADKVKPTVTLNSLNTNVTQASTVTFSAKATDDVGIQQVEFFVDNQSVGKDSSADSQGNYEAPYAWTLSQNGSHTLKVVATDTSGNTQSAETTVKVEIVPDTQKPEVVIDGIPTSIVTTPGTFTIFGKATDNVGVVSVRMLVERLDEDNKTVTLFDKTSDTLTSFTYDLAVDATLNGVYKVTITARDAAGNEQTLSKSVMVRIETAPAPVPDPTPPAPTPPAPDPTPPAPTPPTPTPDPTPTPSPDTQAPTVTITLPNGTITTEGDYTITISLSDNVGVTTVNGYVQSALGRSNLNNLSTAGGTATIHVSKLFNGVNTIYITATDAAGNVGKASASVTVAIP